MKTSNEIIDLLEQTYPLTTHKTFLEYKDVEIWVKRKCDNFEKIFREIIKHKSGSSSLEYLEVFTYLLNTSDVDVVFKIIIDYDEWDGKYSTQFKWYADDFKYLKWIENDTI
jgi:hypothetical protein